MTEQTTPDPDSQTDPKPDDSQTPNKASKKSTSKKSEPKLRHSEGGATTRDDPSDLGVPMIPGSPKERQGPEDALGEGPKRGDYSGRLGDANYKPHEMKPIEGAKPGQPKVSAEAQAPRVDDVGDAEGKKGGVETAQ